MINRYFKFLNIKFMTYKIYNLNSYKKIIMR